MRPITRLFWICLIAGCLPFSPWGQRDLLATSTTGGGVQNSNAAHAEGLASHELTAADLEAFLDGIIPEQLSRNDIAGATVAVVKDGKLLFAKGYGFADLQNRTPVSADGTLFRVGSISKLFAWTAVMQLFEQHKLDLDRDVNDYLDFKIPEAFGKPITLRNLLTHTPGFEEQIKDAVTFDPDSPDLGHYLRTHIPTRIYAPGTVPAYSNYGAALAGYIVQRVSGRPFNEYVEENIFKPLGMAHSTFSEPLPVSWLQHMSRGYQYASDAPKPFETIRLAPAGSLSSTALDISRFIVAHLQDGQIEGARILAPETVRLMHSRLYALDPAANGMCYGFYEESSNGHRIIGHAGDTSYFSSNLKLVPDAGIGFFVSYNSRGSSPLLPRDTLWRAFLDRYLPYTPPLEPTLSSAQADSRTVSGDYRDSRGWGFGVSFLKSLSLIEPTSVKANDDGTIEVSAFKNASGRFKTWHEVAPMTFREVNGQDILIFKPDQTGHMRMLWPYPFEVSFRMSGWDNSKILVPVAAASLLFMLLALLSWPVAALVRKHYGRELGLSPSEKRLRLGVRLALALDLFFVFTLTGLVLYGTTHYWVFSSRGNVVIHLLQAIGVVGTAGTLVVLYDLIQAWTRGHGNTWSRLQATMLALASVGFIWLVIVGNLLSFNSKY